MTRTDLMPRIDVAVDDAPPAVERPRPARRPFRATALRMAVRGLREQRRTAWLLVALVAIPVLLATVVGLGATRLPTPAEEDVQFFGRADGVLQLDAGLLTLEDGGDATELDLEVDPGRVLGGFPGLVQDALPDDPTPADLLATGTAVLTDLGVRGVEASVEDLDGVHVVDLGSFLLDGRYLLRDGRTPASPDEATLSSAQAERLDLGVGDDVTISGAGFDVVGIVDLASATGRHWAAVPPTALDRVGVPADATAFFHVDADERWVRLDRLAEDLEPFEGDQRDVRLRDDGTPLAPGDGRNVVNGIATPLGMASLVATVLLAVAGLVAGAVWHTRVQRRIHTLGLLLVNGADDRQVRTAVVREATVVGLAGAVAGLALGVVVAVTLSEPVLRLLVGSEPLALDMAPATVLAPALLGLLGSLAAALWPAHRATRVTAQQALAGRVPTPTTRRSTVFAAAGLLVLSGLLLGVLDESSAFPGTLRSLLLNAAFVVCLLVAFVSGAVLLLPLVRGVGSLAVTATARLGRPPGPTLVAFRDAARQGGRTGAAVAVVGAMLVVPVAISLAANVDDAAMGEAFVEVIESDDRRSVRFADSDTEQATTLALLSPAAVQPGTADADPTVRAAAVLAQLDGATVEGVPAAQLRGVAEADLVGDGADAVDAAHDRVLAVDPLATPGLDRAEREWLVAGNTLVPAWDCEPADAASPEALLVAELGRCSTLSALLAMPIVDASRADEADLVTPVVLADLSAGTGTGADADTVVDGARAIGLDVTIVSDGLGGPSTWAGPLPVLATQAAVALAALLVVGLMLMLTATETDRDLDVLFAVGAEPRLRPQVLARQAWLVTTLGGVLAVGLALLAVLFGLTGVGSGLGWVAWSTLAMALVGLPLVVAGVVRLFARRGRATPPVRQT